LAVAVQAIESALAGGQLSEAGTHLAALDEALAKSAPGRALQTRIDAVQAEYARLKGWQQWSGGRAREGLVLEAEALARAADEAGVSIKHHANAIERLRERWKELDRLGGATSRALWQRFDAALKQAYLPVGAHLEKLKSVRRENLEARRRLLTALDAVQLAAADGAEAANWRELSRVLEQFRTEW